MPYVFSGPVQTCLIDKDFPYPFLSLELEHHVERRQVDSSACNFPDRWQRWIVDDKWCNPLQSAKDCCFDTLDFSIDYLGGDVTYWCNRVDQDLCH